VRVCGRPRPDKIWTDIDADRLVPHGNLAWCVPVPTSASGGRSGDHRPRM